MIAKNLTAYLLHNLHEPLISYQTISKLTTNIIFHINFLDEFEFN